MRRCGGETQVIEASSRAQPSGSAGPACRQAGDRWTPVCVQRTGRLDHGDDFHRPTAPRTEQRNSLRFQPHQGFHILDNLRG